MAANHNCNGKAQTLDPSGRCGACGTVCKDTTKAMVAVQARKWTAAEVAEHTATDAALLTAINADKLANPKAWGL